MTPPVLACCFGDAGVRVGQSEARPRRQPRGIARCSVVRGAGCGRTTRHREERWGGSSVAPQPFHRGSGQTLPCGRIKRRVVARITPVALKQDGRNRLPFSPQPCDQCPRLVLVIMAAHCSHPRTILASSPSSPSSPFPPLDNDTCGMEPARNCIRSYILDPIRAEEAVTPVAVA